MSNDSVDPIPLAVAQIVAAYISGEKGRTISAEQLCNLVEAVGASVMKIEDVNKLRPHGRDVWKELSPPKK